MLPATTSSAEEAAKRELAARQAQQQAAAGQKTPAGKPIATSTVPGTSRGNVIQNALKYIGKPYVWAASGPDGFDCSGLTMRAYAEAGISIPHSSASQYAHVRSAGHLVTDPKLLVPGDLTFYGSPVHHVAIYIGNGQVVHAPTFGQSVKIASVNMWGNFVGGGSW